MRVTVVVCLNALQGIRVQPQGNTDVLPVCREWSQLTLHIKKIITGVWSKQINVLPCGYLIEHVVCKHLCELLEKRFKLDRVAERGLSVYTCRYYLQTHAMVLLSCWLT